MPKTVGNIKGYNLFAYCFNNPVNMKDENGNWAEWVEDLAIGISIVLAISAAVTMVVVATAFTAGTGSAAAVYGASIFLGATLSGINGGIANVNQGNSYINGWLGGAVSGGIQSAASRLPGGTIWGGALGSGIGTAITMGCNNWDPYSADATLQEIVSSSVISATKAGLLSCVTAYMSNSVGGIDYKTGELIGGVANQCNGLMPSLTLSFAEGIKAFFGAVDDALVYVI